jgi:hypothetical protein
MSRARIALVSAVAGSALLPAVGAGQDFPVSAGTLEVQVGVAGIVLPEESRGTFSAQPEVRVGWFLRERLELQAEGDVRVWPLGTIAARSYGVSGNLLWYPPLADDRHDLYFLGGGGGAYTDPPGPAADTSFDPLLRGGVGLKVPLEGLNEAFRAIYFTAEYRGELILADSSDFVSGIALGLSRFP